MRECVLAGRVMVLIKMERTDWESSGKNVILH